MGRTPMKLCFQCATFYEDHLIEQHHLFPQTKQNKKNYPDIIHHPFNRFETCEECHKTKGVIRLTEIQFCMLMETTPRTKQGKIDWERCRENHLIIKLDLFYKLRFHIYYKLLEMKNNLSVNAQGGM